MGKSIKFKNDNFLDSSGIVHNRKLLNEILNSIYNTVNACRIYRSGDYTLTINGPYNHHPTYPFNTVALNVNATDIELNNNGIKLLKNCSVVRISAVLNIDLNNEAVQINILKNGSSIFTYDSGTRSGMVSVGIPPIDVSASINDVFTLNVGASVGRNYLTRGSRSSFQVEIIK